MARRSKVAETPRTSFRVWAIFLILKILEIGSFLLIPVYSYRLASPYILRGFTDYPIVTNVFKQWMLGVTIDLFVILALALVGTIVFLVGFFLWEVFLQNYIDLNMKWARKIAGDGK